MNKILLTIILLFSFPNSYSEVINFDQFTMEIEEEWIVEDEYGSLVAKKKNGKDEISLFQIQLPEKTPISEIIKKGEESLYSNIGIFTVSSGLSKFDQFKGTYSESWLLYTEYMIMQIKYESYQEINTSHKNVVMSLIKSGKWKQP